MPVGGGSHPSGPSDAALVPPVALPAGGSPDGPPAHRDLAPRHVAPLACPSVSTEAAVLAARRAESDAQNRRRTWPDVVALIASYACAVVPTGVATLVSIGSGWEPTSDDAMFSWRAWNVISRHPTLLGSSTHGVTVSGHSVFAPGPILSWIMAVPVHVNPTYGGLIASAVMAMVAQALIVASARSWGGNVAGLLAAAGLSASFWTEPKLLLNPMWTPWIGLLWFAATLGVALPVMRGRLGWLLPEVVAASVAAQAHLIYALPAVAIGAVSAVFGLIEARKRPPTPGLRLWPWVTASAFVGLILWSPVMIQQLGTRYGNLSLAWHAHSTGGPTLGLDYALHGLSSAVAVPPSWVHELSQTGGSAAFFEIIGQMDGRPLVWGVLAGALLCVALVWGWSKHDRSVRNMALVAMVAYATVVVTVAGIPTSDTLEMTYLIVVFIPVGILTWYCIGYFVWRVLASRWSPTASPGSRHRLVQAATTVGVAAVMVASVAPLVQSLGYIPSDVSIFGGPATVRAINGVVPSAERVTTPGRPFMLQFSSLGSLHSRSVELGVAFRLFVDGREVRFHRDFGNGSHIGAGLAAVPGTEVVRCDVQSRRCEVAQGRA